VKSRVVTTAMQCIVRFLVVTIFSNGLAVDEVRYHWSYAAMVGAWTISEIVRYSYYLFDSAPAGAPLTMIWCRYSFFIVLYPIGALGEALQMYQGLDVVKERFGIIAYYVTILVLILYPTGLGIMYSHMLKQRKKHLTAAYEMEARVQQAVAEYQQSKQK
jgi:very-long-chain (3R)-3-hydroxyacyl-CoA dehydratase